MHLQEKQPINYRVSSNRKRPQKIVAPNFSWFLIGSRIILSRPIFHFKPFLKALYHDLYLEVENFCLTLILYEIPQKIVSPKRLRLEKIVALPFEDLRHTYVAELRPALLLL